LPDCEEEAGQQVSDVGRMRIKEGSDSLWLGGKQGWGRKSSPRPRLRLGGRSPLFPASPAPAHPPSLTLAQIIRRDRSGAVGLANTQPIIAANAVIELPVMHGDERHAVPPSDSPGHLASFSFATRHALAQLTNPSSTPPHPWYNLKKSRAALAGTVAIADKHGNTEC